MDKFYFNRNIFFIIFILPTFLFSQGKQLNEALKEGYNNANRTYYTRFDKHHEASKVDAWMEKNGYKILKYSTSDWPVFGSLKTGYENIYFMKSPDYDLFVENAKRLAAQENKSKVTKVEWTDFIAPLLAGVAIYKGVEWYKEQSSEVTKTINLKHSYEIIGNWEKTPTFSVLDGTNSDPEYLKIKFKCVNPYYLTQFHYEERALNKDFSMTKSYSIVCNFSTKRFAKIEEAISSLMHCTCLD